MKVSGEINLCSIYDSLDTLINHGIWQNTIIVIRSTAVSGTTDKLAKKYPTLEFAFIPEFLREKTAIQDMLNADRMIIGAEKQEIYEKLKSVFIKSGYSTKKCKYVFVNRKTAEAIKYISNIYLATKVTFANEIYNICQMLKLDYKTVVDAVCLDKRINRNYGWDVPGGDNEKGFGGRCFPKDLNALIYLAKEKGYFPYFLEEVRRSNLIFRGTQDWLNIEGVKGEKQ